MFIPPADAIDLHKLIPGAVSNGQGDFAIPCSVTVNVSMILNGESFSIPPKDYVGLPLNGSTLCQSNFVGQQIGDPDQWLVGDVFLKNVCPSSRQMKLILFTVGVHRIRLRQ